VDRVEASERAALNQVASQNQERLNQFDPNVSRPIGIEGPRRAAMGGGRKATLAKLPRQSGVDLGISHLGCCRRGSASINASTRFDPASSTNRLISALLSK
jgi:hypothetical protein